jgi:hypothetical protein
MVTVLGLFMAPTLLPLLAGLTVRRLNRRGALFGFLGGLAAGLAMLALKTWWLPLRPGGTTTETVYFFEGLSLLVNTAATVLGMVLGSLSAPRDPAVDQFFEALDRPVRKEEVPPSGTSGALPVIGASTVGVGVLLIVAGLFSGSNTARLMDLSIGAALLAGGYLFLRSYRRTQA